MKIHGAEGLSPANIRDEVNRGGRLVIYTYCVSLLILTLKRPTSIRLIRAGHSPAAAAWPWIGLSLLLGWWGIPWGPIYTIETIYRNLCGGVDVTDAVLREIMPAAAADPAPHVPPAPTTFTSAAAPKRTFNLKVAALMAGAVSVLVVLGGTLYCLQKQQDLTVVLVSGLDQPYSVRLNGTSYRLAPHAAEVLHLAEGDFTLTDTEGSHVVGQPLTFRFALPFFDHLGTEQVAIINPDRAAILLNEEVPYYSDHTTPPEDEKPVFSLLANQASYFIPKPDYVIEKANPHISMPSGTTRLVKTRLENLSTLSLERVMEILAEKSGYGAARDHFMILAPRRSDEEFLTSAAQLLKPEDLERLLRLRLAERPVLTAWHRFYQQCMEFTRPEHDLVGEYRAYVRAEPGNGALLYLLGRQTPDYAEAARLWQQALAATPPCLYAHGAMGYDAMCEGRFADALAHYTASEQAGLGGASRKQFRRQLHWALNQPAMILTELAAERKAAPLDLALADEEIRATISIRPDAGQTLKAAFLTTLKTAKTGPADLADAEAFLQAGIAYQRGDLASYAALVSRFKSPFYQFRAAIARGDLKAATAVITALPHPRVTDWLLLSLLAQEKGDSAAADSDYGRACEGMKTESHEFRRIAAALAAPTPDAQAICVSHLDAEDKRVLLTVLGLRQAAQRDVYFAFARKMNFNPEFPSHLLRSILAPTAGNH